jgi:hypothetical protein
MDDKLLLRYVIDVFELSNQISDTLESSAAEAERLSGHLYQILEKINPIVSDHSHAEETWEDYKERTINYINGVKK